MSDTIKEYRPEKNLLMFTVAGAALGFIAGKVLGIASNYILMAIIAVIGSFAMLAYARIRAGAKYGISQNDCVNQAGDYAFFKNKSLEMRDLSGKIIKDNGIEAVPKSKLSAEKEAERAKENGGSGDGMDSLFFLFLVLPVIPFLKTSSSKTTEISRRFFVGRFVFAFFAAAIFFSTINFESKKSLDALGEYQQIFYTLLYALSIWIIFTTTIIDLFNLFFKGILNSEEKRITGLSRLMPTEYGSLTPFIEYEYQVQNKKMLDELSLFEFVMLSKDEQKSLILGVIAQYLEWFYSDTHNEDARDYTESIEHFKTMLDRLEAGYPLLDREDVNNFLTLSREKQIAMIKNGEVC